MAQELPGVERPMPLTNQEHEQLNNLLRRLNDIGEVCYFILYRNIFVIFICIYFKMYSSLCIIKCTKYDLQFPCTPSACMDTKLQHPKQHYLHCLLTELFVYSVIVCKILCVDNIVCTIIFLYNIFLCVPQRAGSRNVRVLMDAEQTYYQPAIRNLALHYLMKKYNTEHPVIYDTIQSYLKVRKHRCKKQECSRCWSTSIASP